MTSTTASTTATAVPADPHLLGIPTELRAQIYAELDIQDKTLQPTRLLSDNDMEEQDTISALAQVCSLTRSEVLPLWLSNNTFFFRDICYTEERNRTSIDGTCQYNYEHDVGMCSDLFRQWTKRIGWQSFSRIRSLQMEVHNGERMVRFWIQRPANNRQCQLKASGKWNQVAVSDYEDPPEGVSLSVEDVLEINIILGQHRENVAEPALTVKFVWKIVDGLFRALKKRVKEEYGLTDSAEDEEEEEDDQEDAEGLLEDWEDDELGGKDGDGGGGHDEEDDANAEE